MVSEHFSWDECIHTDTGLSNELPQDYAKNAIRLAEDVLEPWRVLIGPLKINSWFRSKEVNKAVGGEIFSAHMEARAADVVPNGDITSAFKMLLASDIPFDKAILEHHNSSWIHVQINVDGQEPRRHALVGKLEGNRMVYTAWNSND